MNERIRELAEQAEMSANKGDHVDVKFMMAKFAELIVLECVNAVMDGTKEGDHYAMQIEQHFNKSPGGILHFGVE